MWYVIVLFWLMFPEPLTVDKDQPPEAWAALKKITLILEINGPDEHWNSDFNSEYQYAYFYFHLLHNAPPLADVWKFPDSATANACMRFNDEYCNHLSLQLFGQPNHSDDIQAAIDETRLLYKLWWGISVVNARSTSWSQKRLAMMRVRDAIGEENYAYGRLPPCVPIWRFKEFP